MEGGLYLNHNVVEILTLLVDLIVWSQEPFEKEEELIDYLLDQGYYLDDIKQALGIFFYGGKENFVIDLTPLAGIKVDTQKPRVLSNVEQFRLDKESLAVLEQISNQGLLDLQKWEYLFLVLDQLKDPLNVNLLWEALTMYLDDSDLILIAKNIPQFKDKLDDIVDKIH